MAFGKRLKAARAAHKWTAEETSLIIGVSRAHVFRLERGVGDPLLSTVVRLADEVGESVDAILGRETPAAPLPLEVEFHARPDAKTPPITIEVTVGNRRYVGYHTPEV